MQAHRLIIMVLLLAATLVLVGCDFAAGSEGAVPTVQETPQGEVQGQIPDDARLALTVGEEPFTLSDLSALPRAQISAAGQNYEGVAILDLLAAARVTEVLSITLVARDAVSVELDVPSLTPSSILAFAPGDVLNAVLPDLAPEQWLEDVVVIDAPPEARIALRVGEVPFALEDLQAMEQVEVQAGGDTYEGVPIQALLGAAGRDDAVTFTLVDRQGESVEVPTKELMAESILAIAADDSLQAVLPGLSETYWLPDVVEIRTAP